MPAHIGLPRRPRHVRGDVDLSVQWCFYRPWSGSSTLGLRGRGPALERVGVSSIGSGQLAQWLADAARDLEAAKGTQATLDQVCELAVAVVAGCRSAKITERHHGDVTTMLAASDDTARALHKAQDDLRDGPGVEAIWHDRVVWSEDLTTEQRWPAFAAEATKHGVRSVVAIQLYTHQDTLGALTLFSDLPGAFDEVTRDVAQLFAAHAAVALADARNHAQMSQGLTTRQRIGQATGILAERHRLTTDEAFTMLVKSSQQHNIKLRDLAERLVTTEDEARLKNR
ncbi:MAG: ANTAR domain-containing protein [Streptosporangiales bacterium]|nr:ANTAR domain-containing protein [Streptosporangiales bacterium]